MKKYLILVVALLFATMPITTAQRKVATDELQVTTLKNAETIGFDEKGNAVAKEFPEVDLSAVEEVLETKLDAGTYTGTAEDLANSLLDLADMLQSETVSTSELQSLIERVRSNESALNDLGIADVQGLQDEISRLEGLIANSVADESDPVFTAWNKDYNDLINKPTIPDLTPINTALNAKLDAGGYNGTAADLAAQIANNSSSGAGGSGDFVPYTGANKEVDLTDSKIIFKSKYFSNNDVELNKYRLTFNNAGEAIKSLSVHGIGFEFSDKHSNGTLFLYPESISDDFKTLYIPYKSGVLATTSDIPNYQAGDGIEIDSTNPNQPVIKSTATSGGANVQSDWAQTQEDAPDFIKNKPLGIGGGLIKIEENGNVGYRLKGYDPSKYEVIGDKAIDFSFNSGSNPNMSFGASGSSSAIGGGVDNRASGDKSTIGGGYYNNALGDLSTVGGGNANEASGSYSTIGGGRASNASGSQSTVSGGSNNRAYGNASTISGGYNNNASGTKSVVSGGSGNNASGNLSAIGGGNTNKALGVYSVVCGGNGNHASGNLSIIVGGGGNRAYSFGEVVLGCFNSAYTPNSTNSFNPEDRLLVVGNGANIHNRSDAMIVYKNGNMDLNGLLKLKPMTAPSSPQKGMIYFDAGDNKLKCYDGTNWHNLF